MKVRFSLLKIACVLSLGVASIAVAQDAQTFQIGPDNAKSPQAKQQQKSAKQQQKSAKQQQGQNLGFGTNIQNARIGRAAELALKKGEKGQALDLARRAVHAAPNDPRLWFLLGYAARLNARYGESVDAYNHGLSIAPGSLDGKSGLAQNYAAMGRTADAQKLLQQVVSADPRRRNDTLLLGETYMRSKDYQSALEWLNRAERAKQEARSEVLLAISYEQLKRLDEANRYLQLAKRHAPNNPDVQRTLAGYYRQVGKYGDAIAALKSIKNPKPDVLAELGYTYQLDGKLTEAARTYEKAANSRPKDMQLQLSAAQAEVAINSIDDANRFLGRAAQIDPNFYRLHAIRGVIAKSQDRPEEGVKEYQDALAHLPATPAEGPLYGIQLHVNLMQLYHGLQNESAAQQQLTVAQNQINALDLQGPSRAPFLRLRSLIKLNAGNLDGALADIHAAIALAPQDRNNLQQNGDILMKMGRTQEAIATYKKVLDIDPKDRFALTSLGYASRTSGQNDEAEKYFHRLAQVAPDSYVPYLALGDLYTSRHQFKQAQTSYTKAYSLSKKQPMIVAGAMNAAIEAHTLDVAGEWLSRAPETLKNDPHVLREAERYYSFKGNYEESARAGEQALKSLTKDRDVVVYLGYDLLHLKKYDELLQLTAKYNNVFPKEPDLPLLAGYVHKAQDNSEAARLDFTEAIKRDPKIETAYVNRGYVLNDLHQSQAAAADFDEAVKLEPKDGQAHLGLAYANLALNKNSAALKQAEIAQQTMGDFKELHVIRAIAYGREGILSKAADEYRAALKFSPDDPSLHLGLGNALFSEHRFHDAIVELQTAEKFAPTDPSVDALLARSYASLNDRAQALHYVDLAEKNVQTAPPSKKDWGEPLQSVIYVSTGQALSTLGDDKGAMLRFTKALETPRSNRVSVRLAIAHTMQQQGHNDDAQRQIALALMEAEAGDTEPVSGMQFVSIADVFRGAHDFELSQNYLERAKRAGAPDSQVRIGMANNYLAVGDTVRAKAQLDAVRSSGEAEEDYQFLIAQANVFRQEHQGAEALTSFAQASNAAGEDPTASQGLLAAGGEEGWSVNRHLSLLSNLTVMPLYEDSTVYVLDAKLDATQPVGSTDTGLLPPPRSSIQTQWTDAYHLHIGNLPTATGFFQLRNARGTISVPATNAIVNRNTTDWTLNIGVSPSLHLGTDAITFNSGVQGTLRRDSESARSMNQNLFREFTYLTTTSFFDVISANAFIIHEHGPFTESNLTSSTLTAGIDFRVGAPWGSTALVTGWGSTDQKFSPRDFENHFTSSYVGLEHRFGEKLKVRGILEDVRAWRVVDGRSGIAQNLRPAAWVNFTPTKNWSAQFSSAYSSTRSFHNYDNSENGFSVSYAMPFHRKYAGEGDPLTYAYPIRFTAGFQDQSFFNFSGGHSQQFRPYFGITIF